MDNVHQHSEEIEKSRSRPRTSSASSRGTRISSAGSRDLGPLRPTSAGRRSQTPDMGGRAPLPPIRNESECDFEVPIINPATSADSNVIANSMAASNKTGIKGCQYPRVLGFKRELSQDPDEVSDEVSEPERTIHQRAVSFFQKDSKTDLPSISRRETVTMRGVDGADHLLVSQDCQTEWSWLEDLRMSQMARTPSTLLGKASHLSMRSKLQSDDELDDDIDIPVKLPKGARGVSRDSDRLRTPGAASEASRASKMDTVTVITEGSEVTIPPPFDTDDTYGIPILEVSSSDSDLSDDDLDEFSKAQMEGSLEPSTLPSIGPPQILQYNRESDMHAVDDSIIPEEGSQLPFDPTAPSGGIFEGICEFCGGTIKQFPSLEEQKNQPPEELFCCEDYRQFVNFMLSHPLHEKFNVDKLIDIAPHPPHGSKQARRAAKERAAQRMRERELARQQAAVSGMGPSMGGGGGGGGGPSNFYQFARQMKTINYQLSSQKCLEEGWTVRPPSPMVDTDGEIEVFEPQPKLPYWANKDYKDSGLVQKFYEDGSRFVILFPDGTGTVYYPSSRPAIHIVSIEPGLYSYLVFDDSIEKQGMLGVFDPDGHGTSYYQHGVVRVCMDPYGGLELDPRGFRKRRWSWKEQVQHVHAPPIQPITFALSAHLALRIMSQDNIVLTFKTRQRSCRFHVGAHLKLVAPENMPPAEPDEDQWFRDEVNSRIQNLFSKVSNLLKFPKSPKVSSMPSPTFISSRLSRIDREREMVSARATSRMEKEKTTVVVN